MPILPNINLISQKIQDKYSILNNAFIRVAKADIKDKIDIEIGDSKQTDFYPQFKVMRWDNECNLSFRLIDSETGQKKISTIADKIVWEKGNIKANFYSLSGEEHPEGAYEFDIHLAKKPKTNKIQFSVNTKGVDFFYQPALTQEEIDEGCFRPENVVGSYAVYASEQKTNYVGGKEYKCGKVGHIFRPRIEDSIGNWVWGELNIDTEQGILSVTIPQEFLDDAAYPVKHAAGLTFGYTTQGASGTSATYSVTKGSVFTGAAGTVTSLSICVKNSSAMWCMVGMYTHSDSVIAITEKRTSDGLATRVKNFYSTSAFTFTSSAVDYVICGYRNDNGGYIYYDAGSANQGHYFTGRFTTPATFTHDNNKYSIYATYTAAAAGTNIKLNIGDSWKDVTKIQINIGDSWKNVTKAQVNIGDTWKTIF